MSGTLLRTRPFIASALLSACLLGSANPAFAQSDEQRAGARSLATEGAQAFNEGRFKDAVDLFTKAESLMHAPPHLLFTARAHAKLGQFVKAREAYMKIVKEQLAPNAPQAFRDAQSAAEEERKQVEPHIGRLTVKVEGADAAKDLVVAVDGQAIPSVLLGVPQPMDPGEHTVTGTATGFRSAPVTASLKDAGQGAVTLKMEVDHSVPPPSATPAAVAGGGNVVSTPPSTHALWSSRALAAGKHVVVEKPFAIRTEEADAILAEAGDRGLLAAVYQNRRFDPDHRAIRRAADAGLLGEVFHVEAFVGGYAHPCNLWHSDADVSGGAFYDWGAHVLDQILDLLPGRIEHVTAAEHKRVWLDVTNADHSRVTVRFANGAEATFVYSDVAAALKPRWYMLGTRGAIVGHWRIEKVISRTDIGTLAEDVLAPADSPPVLDLHAPDGSVTRLATPAAPAYAFHAELADRLQLGLDMSVTGEQSRRVLAVMEAAAASARDGGRPVVPR